MGRSQLCNYHINVYLSNQRGSLTAGAMSLKQAYGNGLSFAEAYKGQLVKVEVIPQTAAGRKVIQKDYGILDCNGKLDRYNIGEPVPYYAF